MSTILMPKATAVWLIDNTALTFEQISKFCDLHLLEVKGIADGDVATGIRGADPIANGQLARSEIEKAEGNADYDMKGETFDHAPVTTGKKKRKAPRYTPLSRRQDRPDAIAWIVRNHPEVSDPQISKLIGTTKPTINAIRDRTHWKTSTINPTDPVSLGLCSQIELDEMVKTAAEKLAKKRAKDGIIDDEVTTDSLAPVADTPAEAPKTEHTLESLFKPSTHDQ
ncbi:DUF1013 domain-containing protein [Robiginitomaculum antarcticum]|uniref:DUF1013 domain-containing protein n=1 Tax=Robiginitomaculum antarcticum TaxID=437507 RepID=UPI0003721615|nr:cell cycle transcriptional regulator TrcR [Robiginitomaculum antarcticum]